MSLVGQRSWTGTRWSLAALAVLAIGCPGKKVTGPGGETDGGGASTLLLTRVGLGSLLVHPSEPFTIQAQLYLSNHGPIPDAKVTYKLTEAPGMLDLSANSATTDANGLAQVKVTCEGVGQYALRADSAGAKSTAVWKINCEPVIKHLRIVSSASVTPSDPPNNQKASANAAINTSIPLAVKVTEDGDNQEVALPNQQVTFTVGMEAGMAGFQGGTTPSTITVTTLVDGTATVPFSVGNATGIDVVQAGLADNSTAPVEFDVNVTLGCMSSADCSGGECDLNTHQCMTNTGSTMCGASDRPCPIGYSCDPHSGTCQPANLSGCTSCPMGFTCDTSTMMCVANNMQCTSDSDCPNGQCRNGTCYPNSGPTIDVTGHWYTKHNFDVHDALPGWLQFSSTAIRTIDQVLLGQLGLPSWVNAIIRGIVQQFVPQWVQSLVYLLDNVLTLFSNLRAEGEMDLSAIGGNQTLISGNESWTMFDFYLLSQCGQNIGGDPSMPPPCALLNVYTADLQSVNLSVKVKPFTAKVVGPDGNGNFTLLVDQRSVQMKFAGLILYVLNQAVEITTGYPTLVGPPAQDSALYNLIDCPGLAAQIQSIIPIDTTALCEAAVSAIADVIAQQLQSIVVSEDVLSFSGQATAWADPNDYAYGGPSYATDLGYPDFDTRMPADGTWKGNFSIIGTVHDVPGNWRASRDPIPPM